MIAAISLLVHIGIVVGLLLRVISRKPPVGTAYAWLLLISMLPYVGAVIYLLIGERRIGSSRSHKIKTLQANFQELAKHVIPAEHYQIDWSQRRPCLQSMSRMGLALGGSHVVHGSRLELFSDTEQILTAMARDIDGAKQSIVMEFYIWNVGGLADEVLEAFIRASRRGVHCLALIDALGARPWWKSHQPAQLRAAGVELREALPVSPLRALIGRTDLRLHRKIVVIDGSIAWTGSMNMVDPRFFKENAGVGLWVDAMARIQGAAVAPLAATALADWLLESKESLEHVLKRLPRADFVKVGSADLQVIRSGPGQNGDALLQMILACINNAESELVLTTPYLIPAESLLEALRGASARGVMVRIIVPEKVDSFMTRLACRSYFDDLMATGVRIHLYRGGLLHTKSIRVDEDLCMFGTANFDIRSLWLNYEVSLFVYDREFNRSLKRLHDTYLSDSVELDRETWSRRSFRMKFLEDSLRLMSPLL